ncbi:MAG TPA: hypothetical protein VGG34_02010 [Opitutaceae bacterium]|jgi:hypothetical protein
MSADPRTSGADYKERLILACELDRLNLRLAMTPTPFERLSLKALEKIGPLVPHLPGKIGKIARRISQGTNLLRGVYDVMFN